MASVGYSPSKSLFLFKSISEEKNMASSNLISRRRLQLSEILDRNDVIFIEDIRRDLEQIQSCLLLLRHCQLRMEASCRKKPILQLVTKN